MLPQPEHSESMRLRLKILRSGLPSAQLLWNTNGPRTTSTTRGVDSTVAQFLEQVNEVIPLELGDWGLEDYVVEVNGFECLHFNFLRDVLKDEDEVTIRPLQTSDIRQRRIAGRHQISTDGKHLIDGVAFGRLFLRKVDRPPIRILSRKDTFQLEKATENGFRDSYTIQGQLVAPRESADADSVGSNSDNDEDSEDYDSEEWEEELKGLLDDEASAAIAKAPQSGPGIATEDRLQNEPARRVSKRKRDSGSNIESQDACELVDENGMRFKPYHNPLLDLYYEQPSPLLEDEEEKPRLKVRKTQKKDQRRHDMSLDSRRSSRSSPKSVRFAEDQLETPATITEFEDLKRTSDEGFDPLPDSNPLESDKENVAPSSEDSSQSFIRSDTESSSSSSPSSSDNSDDDFSFPALTNSGGSKRDEERLKSETLSTNRIRETSTTSSKLPKQESLVARPSRPPGQGMTRTKKRNERRRLSQKLSTLKKEGILPESTTIQEFKEWCQSDNIHERESEDSAAIEAKRSRLLSAIATGDLEVANPQIDVEDLQGSTQEQAKESFLEQGPSQDGSSKSTIDEQTPFDLQSTPPEGKELETVYIDADGSSHRHSNTISPTTQNAHGDLSPQLQTIRAHKNFSISQDASPSTEPVRGATMTQDLAVYSEDKRRSKLDIASSRRLLFGSLGLRTPKTKSEEGELRQKLMEGVRPVRPGIKPEQDPMEYEAEDVSQDDSWRSRIRLFAVDCGEKSKRMDTPPFPFVQIWEREQSSASGDVRIGDFGKNKYGSQQRWGRTGPDRKSHGDGGLKQGQDNAEESVLQDVADSSNQGHSKSPDSAEGFPKLHSDLSLLQDLTIERASPGMVIAYKQMEMENWSPVVSDYRRAKIDHIAENGILGLIIAPRDRKPSKPKSFDPRTGQQLYSMFEMPGIDDVDEDGYAEMGFSELINPLILAESEGPLPYGAGSDRNDPVVPQLAERFRKENAIEADCLESTIKNPGLKDGGPVIGNFRHDSRDVPFLDRDIVPDAAPTSSGAKETQNMAKTDSPTIKAFETSSVAKLSHERELTTSVDFRSNGNEPKITPKKESQGLDGADESILSLYEGDTEALSDQPDMSFTNVFESFSNISSLASAESAAFCEAPKSSFSPLHEPPTVLNH